MGWPTPTNKAFQGITLSKETKKIKVYIVRALFCEKNKKKQTNKKTTNKILYFSYRTGGARRTLCDQAEEVWPVAENHRENNLSDRRGSKVTTDSPTRESGT